MLYYNVVKQRTSQRRLYTVAYVTARATLNCGYYLATLYHRCWLYGAEWERRVIRKMLRSCIKSQCLHED